MSVDQAKNTARRAALLASDPWLRVLVSLPRIELTEVEDRWVTGVGYQVRRGGPLGFQSFLGDYRVSYAETLREAEGDIRTHQRAVAKAAYEAGAYRDI